MDKVSVRIVWSKEEFVAGWDCWVRWDAEYPDNPTTSFVAGYQAAAYDNDHGGGSRPEISEHDDNCEHYWKQYASESSSV